MRYVPDGLTVLRIAGSLALLGTAPLDRMFYIIYLFCGLSDMADGLIARKMKVESRLGALLDSIADAVLTAVCLMIFLPRLKLPEWGAWMIGGVVLVRLMSLAAGYIRFGELAFIHTYANKAAGFVLFLFPVLWQALGHGAILALLGTAAGVSAAEELIINLMSGTLDRNRRSVFHPERGRHESETH